MMTDDIESDVRIPRAEKLLIDACAELSAERVLCTSQGWGQLAVATARRLPAAQVACHFLDLHPFEQAQHIAEDDAQHVEWLCIADVPAGPFDLAAIPVSRFGEAELTRDLLQDAYERLTEGGVLVTAVDNRADTWLHAEVAKLFPKVTREPQRMGIVYRGTRRGPLKRRREFRCEFAFRDGGRLVNAVSRPGVFSHRQLDLGARALLEVMEVRAGDRVVDIGCGSGVVGLAAALRAENVVVLGIDSNARAVDCMRQGALLNGMVVGGDAGDLRSEVWRGQETGHNVESTGQNVQSTGDNAESTGLNAESTGLNAESTGHDLRPAVEDVARSGDRPQLGVHRPQLGVDRPQLEAGDRPQPGSAVRVLLEGEGRVPEPKTYDLVVGNPPYYSRFQIAEIFLQAARRALKPGGRVLIVTKKDDWHMARMPQLFANVESREVRGYKVVSGTAR